MDTYIKNFSHIPDLTLYFIFIKCDYVYIVIITY